MEINHRQEETKPLHDSDSPPPRKLSCIRWTFIVLIIIFNLLNKAPDQATLVFLKVVQDHTKFTLTNLSFANNIQTITAIALTGPLGALMDNFGVAKPLTGVVFAKFISYFIQLLNNNYFHSLTLLYIAAPIDGPIMTTIAVAFFKLLLRWYEGKYFSLAVVVEGLSLGLGMILGGYLASAVYTKSGNSLLATNLLQWVFLFFAFLVVLAIAKMDNEYGHYFDKQHRKGGMDMNEWKQKLKIPSVVYLICLASVFIDSCENVVSQNESYFLTDKFTYTPSMIASLRNVTIILEGAFSFIAIITITKYGHQSTFYLINAVILSVGAIWSALISPSYQPYLPSIPLYLIQMGSAIKNLSFKTMVPNVLSPSVIGTIFGTTASVQSAVQSLIVSNGFSIIHDHTTTHKGYFWALLFAGAFGALGTLLVVIAKQIDRMKNYGLDKPLAPKQENNVESHGATETEFAIKSKSIVFEHEDRINFQNDLC